MDASVPEGGTPPEQRLLAPAVLERAAERGIPVDLLRGLHGSGPNGRLRVRDLDHVLPEPPSITRRSAAAEAPAAPPRSRGDDERIVVRLGARARARAARVMADATRAARLTSAVEVDLTAFVTGLAQESKIHLGSLEFHDALVTHVARHVIDVLPRHPMMNARLEMDTDGGRIIVRRDIDLGLHISDDRGEHHAIIERADALTTSEVQARIVQAGLLARAAIRDEDGSDGSDPRPMASFTILDRRVRPPVFETPPLPASSTGALALGALEKRPLADVESGALRVAWSSYLCLSYDHRLIDGADAARFLQELSGALRQPPFRD